MYTFTAYNITLRVNFASCNRLETKIISLYGYIVPICTYNSNMLVSTVKSRITHRHLYSYL